MSDPDSKNYQSELTAWKLKHGWSDSDDGSEEGIRLQVEADRKLPGSDYCVLCGKGPQPINQLRLITRAEDPYIQIENEPGIAGRPSNRVRACPKCFEERYP